MQRQKLAPLVNIAGGNLSPIEIGYLYNNYLSRWPVLNLHDFLYSRFFLKCFLTNKPH
jgi:hypothetical protein